MTEQTTPTPGARVRTYLWPKLLLAALLAGAAISILWVSREAGRVREMRDAVHSATNTPSQQ